MAREVEIDGPLPLGSFVKVSGAAATGGEAKRLVQSGAVSVNGAVESRRGHKVVPGDVVVVARTTYLATARLATPHEPTDR
ncbi:MAG TPA: RNA-binding S4 domain-containing protein [Thermoleophilia bacterium]|nr:RNA-binding S4 domain-containing protein [Thermoleophilia bacterium]